MTYKTKWNEFLVNIPRNLITEAQRKILIDLMNLAQEILQIENPLIVYFNEEENSWNASYSGKGENRGYFDIELFSDLRSELTAFYKIGKNLVNFDHNKEYTLENAKNSFKIIKFLDSLAWLTEFPISEISLDDKYLEPSPYIEWKKESVELVVSWTNKGEKIYSGISEEKDVSGVLTDPTDLYNFLTNK